MKTIITMTHVVYITSVSFYCSYTPCIHLPKCPH